MKKPVMISFKGTALFLCVFLSGLPARAQLGDVRDLGIVQELRVPRDLIPSAPVVAPEHAIAKFIVEPGFRVELVAAEPLVEDPVQIAFDPDGRLWAVELRGYMQTVDGGGENLPIGRVVRLEDTDGDGRMDKSTVFLDKLIMPRAITHVNGGLLVGAPPYLWFCRDTDGDGRADAITEVATDFGEAGDPKRPEIGNPELAPNHLLWTMDNWIQAGHYEARFRLRGEKWERRPAPEHGRWGLTQDDWGRIFYNNSSDQLRANLAPAHYFERNPRFTRWAPLHYAVTKDQRVWPARVNPGINRGYQPEMLRDYRLANFTAGCAPTLYRGHLFPPEYYGNAFVAEPAGNLVKRNIITEHEDSTVSATFAYEGREFLASTDERFRPVDLVTGPDGALYIADLYRGILQNRNSLTTYLRNQIKERGLETPLGLGRIYRVVPADAPKPQAPVRPRFSIESPRQWVEHLRHPNGWWRETAQRLLVEKGDASTVEPLRQLARAGGDPRTRLHALWTLEGMGGLDFNTAARASRDPHPKVRAGGVRLVEAWLTGQQRAEAIAALLHAASDASADVYLQVAFSLGEIGTAEARRAMTALAVRHPNHPFLADAVISGMANHEFDVLAALLNDAAGKGASLSDRLLRLLTACVIAGRDPAQIGQLFSRIADPNTPARSARILLDGAQTGITTLPRRRLELPEEPSALVTLAAGSKPELAKSAAQLLQVVRWPGKPADRLPVRDLTRKEKQRFREGQVLYASTCIACHQADGNGLPGVAPQLAGTDWVTGPADRVVKIILHGLGGPIDVGGNTFNLEMPGFGMLNDEQIAALVTFVRRAWGHEAEPVDAAFVAEVRGANAERQRPWRAEELTSLIVQ